MVKSMTSAYRLMEKDLQEKINEEEKAVKDQELEKAQLKADIVKLVSEKEAMIKEKYEQIERLKA